jgi:hypothetical protein
MPDLKTTLLILGIVLGCCLFLTLGGYFGRKFEVFRVVIFSGIMAGLAVIAFVIYSAIFLLSA